MIESNYTNKELEELNGGTYNYNGKNLSLYEATQKQHYFESNIRNTKRAIESLSKSKDNNAKEAKDSLEKSLKNYQLKYRDFNKQTGLSPDYTKTRI